MDNCAPKQICIPMLGSIELLILDSSDRSTMYPTSAIRKGLVLASNSKDLSNEGLGFGTPIIKLNGEAFFPGDIRITTKRSLNSIVVIAEYNLNFVERVVLSSGRRINTRAFYKIKEYFAGLHRRYPPLRRVIEAANSTLRRDLRVWTQFVNAPSAGVVTVVYTIKTQTGLIHVNVDTSGVPKERCTEVIIINEQGASYFDQYRDSNGVLLSKDSIGTWEETFADEVSFIDRHDNVEFILQKIEGSKMFRGRELISGRLDWAGIAYVMPPDVVTFTYNINIKRATT